MATKSNSFGYHAKSIFIRINLPTSLNSFGALILLELLTFYKNVLKNSLKFSKTSVLIGNEKSQSA